MNNKYDSYTFRMWMNVTPQQISTKLFESLYFKQFIEKIDRIKGFVTHCNEKVQLKDISKEFRLKNNKICNDFIVYLRIFLMSHYKGPDAAHIMATIPVSYRYELFILKFGLNLL